jgi:hypothetical protein
MRENLGNTWCWEINPGNSGAATVDTRLYSAQYRSTQNCIVENRGRKTVMLRGKKSLPWDCKAPSALMLPGGLKGGYLYHVNRHYVKVIEFLKVTVKNGREPVGRPKRGGPQLTRLVLATAPSSNCMVGSGRLLILGGGGGAGPH